MQTLPGIAVSPGISSGESLIITNEEFRIPRRLVTRDAVVGEILRFPISSPSGGTEIDDQRSRLAAELGARCGIVRATPARLLADTKEVGCEPPVSFDRLVLRSIPIAAIKQISQEVFLSQCEAVARQDLARDNAREIDVFPRNEIRKVTPEHAALAPT